MYACKRGSTSMLCHDWAQSTKQYIMARVDFSKSHLDMKGQIDAFVIKVDFATCDYFLILRLAVIVTHSKNYSMVLVPDSAYTQR